MYGCLIAALLLYLTVPAGEESKLDPKALFREYKETKPLFFELFFLSIIYGFFIMLATISVAQGTMNPRFIGCSYLIPSAFLLFLV